MGGFLGELGWAERALREPQCPLGLIVRSAWCTLGWAPALCRFGLSPVSVLGYNFAGMDRKKRLFNRVLIVSGSSALLLFAGYVFFTKRSPHHFFIPKSYAGWVTVKFEKPNAPALTEKDGVVEFRIPESGVLETSSKLETGWSRDEYFWIEGNSTTLIPKHVDCGDDDCRYVHDFKESEMGYESVIMNLPEESDTLLWDGARISKKQESVEVRSGRKTMIHFWVSAQPEPFFYHHDSLTLAQKQW